MTTGKSTVTVDGIELEQTDKLALYALTDVGRLPLIMLKDRSLTLGREPSGRPAITVPDSRMSRDHAQLTMVAENVYRLADCDSKNGTWHNGIRADGLVLNEQDVIRVGNSVFVVAPYRHQALSRGSRSALVGRSMAIHKLRQICRRIAPSDLSVLITGETGTGKEVSAREIHDRSGCSGAFVPVNCGSIPTQLVERELFGHIRGAYTGATQSGDGFIRAAEGGTLFLDEIGELPLEAQAKLLRFLAEKTYHRVGSTTIQKANTRVVAATNRDLAKQIKAGRFREDLFARLEQVRLEVPPLRQRREDIGLLLKEAMDRLLGRRYEIAADVTEALALYDWPRNVRELFTVIQRIPLMRETERFELQDLPDEIGAKLVQRALANSRTKGIPNKSVLVGLLKTHQGNVSAVATALGVHRKQLYRWLEQLDISAASFRTSG